jgi:hypothetical protein
VGSPIEDSHIPERWRAEGCTGPARVRCCVCLDPHPHVSRGSALCKRGAMDTDQPKPSRPWADWEDDVIRQTLNSDTPNRGEQLTRLLEALKRRPDEVEQRIQELYDYPPK